MGIQELQAFLESGSVEGGAVSVDLLRIARNAAQRQVNGRATGTNKRFNVGNKLKLVLDAECCLDRLYGGYFSDWACGGQWNRTVQFLSLLVQALETGGVELTVLLNGALEQQRTSEWVAQQLKTRQRINSVLKHVNMKGTPPPKVWWCAPTCVRTVLRMALRHLNTQVLCTMDDHRQEVIAYCRENACHGLVADDAEYAAFDPPRYFSAQNLKLTYKGSLETKEFMVGELGRRLELTSAQLCVLAALLGNYLLGEGELTDVWTRAGISEPRGSTTPEQLIKALAEHIRTLPPVAQMDTLVARVLGSADDPRASQLRHSIQYYLNGTADGFLKYRTATSKKPRAKPENDTASPFASETNEREQKSLEDYKLARAPGTPPDIVVETDPETTKPVTNGALSGSSSGNTSPRRGGSGTAPRVPVEVMRTATERHQKGLMSPLIYHVLVGGEVRLSAVMEDEQHKEFPPAHLVFRPVRQRVYAVLFNLHHHAYLASKAGDGTTAPDVQVKEWVWTRTNQYARAESVRAEQLSWAVPTVQRLWFGGTVDDKRRRLRAFLTCLDSDSPLILNPSYVPQHMLVLACVLRYLLARPDRCPMRKQELDAFIAHAFSPELVNSQYLQELALPLVTARGVQLAALFMHGVETALLANDACGAPVPWLMCCPWLYFDGKLFHHTLARAAVVKNLLELCENHIDRVVKVERMRKAILEGLDYQFAKQPLPPLTGMLRPGMPPPNCLPPLSLPSTRGPGGVVGRRPVPARGGQLQVAGVVVGQWGANYALSSAPSRGRGSAHHGNNRPTWPASKKNIPSGNKKQQNSRGGGGGGGEGRRRRGGGSGAGGGGTRALTVQLQSGETVAASELKGRSAPEHKGQGDGPN